MKGWSQVTLTDICTSIDYGYTASSINIPIGPKFLRITDIATNIVNWNEVPYCTISEIDKKKYKLSAGDVVIARTGASTGATYTIKESDPKDLVFASYLIRYRINKKIAIPSFIGKLLTSNIWKNYVAGVAGGSAQPGANAKVLGSFSILLPPLDEQRAIAAVLSSLDDKIDLLNRQNVTLEAMAEALFRQWFAITSGERNNKNKIGNLFDISSGKGLKKEAFLENGTYPILGANGKIGTTNEFLYDEKIIYTGRVGTLGNIFTFFEKAWYSDNTLVFTEIKYFYFTYFLLKFLHLEDYNVGSTQPLIRQSDIKNIEIFLPHKIRIEKFEGIAETIFAKIRSNQTQIRTLEKLRDTLLPKLMSGEVRVAY